MFSFWMPNFFQFCFYRQCLSLSIRAEVIFELSMYPAFLAACLLFPVVLRPFPSCGFHLGSGLYYRIIIFTTLSTSSLPVVQSQQTMICRSDPGHRLLLKIKFCWNVVIFIYILSHVDFMLQRQSGVIATDSVAYKT